jgi:hypothetical protein
VKVLAGSRVDGSDIEALFEDDPLRTVWYALPSRSQILSDPRVGFTTRLRCMTAVAAGELGTVEMGIVTRPPQWPSSPPVAADSR